MIYKCETCKKEAEHETHSKCNNCYEVEKRLDAYIKSKKGFDFVLKTLLDHI